MANTSNGSKLALLGGKRMTSLLSSPAWPPVWPATARKLAKAYLSANWSFNGPVEQEFSQAFATFHSARHGIFMAHGTVTLQCALAACGVGEGDEVIVPALTWLATAMAARYLGAKPVFVDIEPATLCMDPRLVEAAITRRTKAIIPVHLYGGSPDMDAIMALAARHKLRVIEDCAHGHGGRWAGKGYGSCGHIGSFSFQQSKAIASGEGGICITDDDELAERLFRLKHIGYGPGELKGVARGGLPADLVCHNYRGTEFQAVILLDQLKKFSDRIAIYNANAARIEKRLAGCKNVRVQSRGRRTDRQSYYALALIFENALAGVPVKRIAEAALAEGFPALYGTYGPVYRHALWNLPAKAFRIHGGSCPVSEGLATASTGVIMHPWLGCDEAVIDSIAEILAKIDANAKALAKAKAVAGKQ